MSVLLVAENFLKIVKPINICHKTRFLVTCSTVCTIVEMNEFLNLEIAETIVEMALFSTLNCLMGSQWRLQCVTLLQSEL